MSRIFQIQEFLKESPNDPFLLHALALEYIKQDNDAEAQKVFEQNKENAPQYVATYYHLGKLFERAGATEKAIEIYALGMDVAKAQGDQHAFSELRSVHEELLY
jgi:uncharacterized protein HemY